MAECSPVDRATRGKPKEEAVVAATSGPTTDHPRGLGPISQLRGKWGWFVALGILMLIAGVLALGNEFLATEVSVYYIGALMLVAGIFQVVHAFGVKSWGRFIWWRLTAFAPNSHQPSVAAKAMPTKPAGNNI